MKRPSSAVLAALLFVLVGVCFAPALREGFLTYDDPTYVTANPHVRGGLSAEGLRWAFRSTEASNWHPLTWISHMADAQLFGLRPWGHHLTSVLLHALNAALLFLLLDRMTGAAGRSFAVAALFGLHPLHVESVAWVAERKDVLSTALALASLWFYRDFAVGRRKPLSYALAVSSFALGLLAKPMIVTLPLLMLLLDIWPLRRAASGRGFWGLVGEKVPFLLLSAASCAATLYAQGRGGAVGAVADFPAALRLENALLSCLKYLAKCFWPSRLAIFYPFFPIAPAAWKIAVSAVALAGISAAAWILRRRGYPLVGWLWFLVGLAPVIGLVQVGGQSMADRYTYLPLTGIFLAVVWGLADASRALGLPGSVPRLAGGAAVACCALLTERQLDTWADEVRLFRHAAEVTADNWVAHANLAAALSRASPDEAAREFRETVGILAAFAEVHDRNGIALERSGHPAEAIGEFRTAIRIVRDLPQPHFDLALALARTPEGRPEAIEELRTAVRLDPGFAGAHYTLGLLLAQAGEPDEAVAEYEAAVRSRPGYVAARYNLGLLLLRRPGGLPDAESQFQAIVRIDPGFAPAREILQKLGAE